MSNWLTELEDSYLTGAKQVICGVYALSPVNTIARLSGSAGFQPAQALTAAWDSACGTPPPPPPAQYGVLGRYYVLRVNNRVNGDPGVLYLPGPVEVIPPENQGFAYNLQYWIIHATGSASTTNPARVLYEQGNIQVPPPPGNPPQIQIVDAQTGQPVDGGTGGYPPLTPQQQLDLDTVLKQLQAIRNTQGYQSAALAGIGAGVATANAGIAAVAAEVAGVAAEVAALAAAVAALETIINSILAKINDLLNRVGSGQGQDCQSAEWTSLTEGVNSAILCTGLVLGLTGLKDRSFTLTDGSGERLATIMDGFDALALRMDLGTIQQIETCGATTGIKTLRGLLTDLRKRIGYDKKALASDQPRTGVTGTICGVQAAIEDIQVEAGELVIVQGFDAPVLRDSLLKLVYNASGKLAQHAYLHVPNPVAELSKAVILAAVAPRQHGDWLVTVAFTSGRTLTGWFTSEATGVSYLTAVAALSADTLKVNGSTATHSPDKSPQKHLGVPLAPVRAFLVLAVNGGSSVAQDWRLTV